MDGVEGIEVRDRVARFLTYEDYLDSQVSDADATYLSDQSTARALVELGYRGSGDTLTREAFEARKKSDAEKHLHREIAPKPLANMGRDLTGKPLLQALAAREELVRNGKLTCIIFLRDINARGQEVSGYIDYAHRLKTDAWEHIFSGAVRLTPRPSDLSFYNWETSNSTSNSTPNFAVIIEGPAGILFKSKRDRKVINVDPRANPGDNTTRTEVRTPEYAQAVIWDHFMRRKS